ncbi:MAG: imidazole glycerol phosphate synthase subunit HisH [Flavobacteriales bacterium]|nr:imidazole glycerol phosphate synthase subunit HisH [Flavobacteriales bacterium]
MIAIINYNAGNTTSVYNAIRNLDQECIITDDPKIIERADHVILPGVGSAGPAMDRLKDKGLDLLIPNLSVPVLGICLGLQLMCQFSEEDETKCMGIFNNNVKKFPPKDKVPHMGWNSHTSVSGELFEHLSTKDDFYFVHSYYVERSHFEIAHCDYILGFSTALKKDNFYGVQFHPEKSSITGQQLLKNFIKLKI